MISPQTSPTCAENNIPEADDNYQNANRLQRAQWLRAAILGATDGLVSTTSLMLGVGAAEEDGRSMILSGLAGGLAGACSMGVGEFISVSTQRDIETAIVSGCNSEKDGQHASDAGRSIISMPASTENETEIIDTNLPATPWENIQRRGIGSSRSFKILKEDAKDGSGTLQQNNREVLITNPYKAAAASVVSFLFGSCVPLAPAILVTNNSCRIVVIVVVTSMALVLFGGFGAYLGGSAIRMSALRVLVGGWIAMAITYGLLKPFDSDGKGHKPTD